MNSELGVLPMMRKLLAVVVLVLISIASRAEYRVSRIATGLDHPWSLCFLTKTEMLVTERPGRLRRVSTQGNIGPPINGVPEVFYTGQGGLFDVVLDPDYANNGVIFLSFASGNARSNATRVVRAHFGGAMLSDLDVILTVHPDKNTPRHFGGRLALLPDGTLLVTTGDGFDFREEAQNRYSQLGKVLRLNRDGSIPKDNPYTREAQGDPLVWTYGHRNPQGLAVDPKTGTVYLHEHGPRGGDEVNILEAGANYGWPAATHGKDYNGATISPFNHLPSMTDPIQVWIPSIAPSGLAIYRGSRFPQWNGDLFIGGLKSRDVRRLELNNAQVVSEHRLFDELNERIRDVRVGPDGLLYLLTDGPEASILRIDAD